MSKWQKKGLKGLGKFGGDIAGDLAGGVVGDQLARVGLNEEVTGYISDEVGDFAEDMTEDAIRGKGKFKRGGHSSSPPPPYSDSRGYGRISANPPWVYPTPVRGTRSILSGTTGKRRTRVSIRGDKRQ